MTTMTHDARAQAEFGAHRRLMKVDSAEALCHQLLDRPDVAPAVAAMARETLARMPELHHIARCRVSDFRRWWSTWKRETCPAIRAAMTTTEATR